MAVELLTGPPASGKKAYIIEKIRDSIKSGHKPGDLLVLTNSRNSAENIRKDIMNGLDSFVELRVESATSFCKKVVREQYHYLNVKPAFKVISDFEKRLFIRNILKRNIDLKFFNASKSREGLIREVSNFIDIAKRNPGWEKNARLDKSKKKLKFEDLILITKIYQQTLEKFNYMDFVDLTLLTRKLYQKNPELIKFKALFVYEAEDMDAIAGDIIELILRKVEDAVISINPDLSIYDFRGAKPDYIMKKLTNNFDYNEIKFEHVTYKRNEFILQAQTRDEQADAVAVHIAGKIKKGINPKDIVIISRSVGENLRVFTDALKKRGINYVLVGGIGFFRQPEIIEFMSLLNCIYRQRDTDTNHLYRAVSITGILTEDQLDVLKGKSVLSGKPLADIMELEYKKESCKFWKIIKNARSRSKNTGIDRFIYDLLTEFGFLKRASQNEFAAMLYGYFYRIVADFSGYYKNLINKPLDFSEFMENLYDLLSGFGKELDIPYSTGDEAVKIMTVQQAKGNVFRIAYVVDMVEGIFPRPFFENPMLSTDDFRALELEPVPGVRAQYEFEKRLFGIAGTRGLDEVIYCWYNTSEDNAPAYMSSFMENMELKPAAERQKEAIIDENDLFLRIIEDIDRSLRDDFLAGVSPKLNLRLGDVNAVTDFDKKKLFDRVEKGIPDVFSYSSLNRFRECPEVFFMEKILKIRTPHAPNMMLGMAVHRILERIHSQRQPDRAAVRKIIDAVWRETDFCSNFEKKNLYLRAIQVIEAYLEVNDIDSIDVRAVEKDISLELNGIRLRGRIDRIDRMDSGDEKVVDYKTSKKTVMEKGLIGMVERGEDFQLPIYIWGTGCRYFSIYWLRKKKGSMEAVIDCEAEKAAEALKKAEDNLVQLVNLIKEGVFVPNPKNCRNCYLERTCSR